MFPGLSETLVYDGVAPIGVPFREGLSADAVQALAANGVHGTALPLGNGAQGCVYSCTFNGERAAIKARARTPLQRPRTR